MLDAKLETLLCVAEEKSFTKASEKLNLTQPAVSNHVSTLEREWGVKLIIRGKGELKLTEKGEIAVSFARRMNAMYEKLTEELRAPVGRPARLRVGITHTAENNKISEALAKYTSILGNCSITVTTDTIKNLYNMLENYELDLAIVEGKVQNANLYSLMLDTDYLVCVVSPEHKLARRNMVTLEDLRKEQMIMRLPSSATRALFDATLQSIGKNASDFNIILEVDNIATIKDLVRKNLGVSILAKSACMSEVKKGKLFALPIENLSLVRETNIVYNKDFTYTSVLEDLTALYREIE